MNPSYEYELLHQFEVIFRDGEHKTQAASRDYSNVWENVIDNPPDEGVTPIHVYRLNGTTCAVIAGMDEPINNEECAMEIVRLASRYDRAIALDGSLTVAYLQKGGLYNRLERYEEALKCYEEALRSQEKPRAS